MKAARKAYHTLMLKKLLRQQMATKRKGQFIGMNQAQSLAIICHAGNAEALRKTLSWAEQLRKEVSSVRVLGYFHEKEIPPTFQPKLHTDYFCFKNSAAVSAMLDTFKVQPFHLLVNLCEETYYPVSNLIFQSAALCKVGTEGAGDAALYDLLFAASADFPLFLQTDMISKYLHMIHNK